MRIKLDLATNFDDELVRQVGELGSVKSIYGKLREDIVGGGRPNFTLPDPSKKDLERHIALAHNYGIQFNYLLNALCTDNREFIAGTNKKMRAFVRELKGRGVDYVTVGSPFMLRMVKEQEPGMKVSVSVYNDIDSPEKIAEWQRLGADELTLHYSFNRNFKRLERALETADVDLRIIANNVCLHECLYRTNHANALAHSSQTGHESGGFFLDYFSMNCGREKLANPVKLISADWIRPEDVHLYEELCDRLGKDNLTIKLTDRSRTTDWLVNVARAYTQRSHEGNLFDILNFIGNKGYAKVRRGKFVIGALTGKARTGKMLEFQDAVFLTPVHADNKAFEGFMERFLDPNHNCDEHVCDDQGWPKSSSEQRPKNLCGYCRHWAEKTLSFVGGEDARQEALKKCKKSTKDMETGETFSK